jgi:hypothetical protein
MNGKADIVRLLIEIRAHINESPVAFQLAAGNGHTEVVQQLLEWMVPPYTVLLASAPKED